MRLQDKQHFLVLRQLQRSRKSLYLFENRQKLGRQWGHNDRVSPIFPVEGFDADSVESSEKYWLTLAGPIYPSKLPSLADQLFLTLGTKNCGVVLQNVSAAESLEKSLNLISVPWETWTIEDNEIKDIKVSEECNAYNKLQPEKLFTSRDLASDSKLVLAEHRAIVRAVTNNAYHCDRKTYDDLLSFSEQFADWIFNDGGSLDSVAKHGKITIANSVLSRHYSQAFGSGGSIHDNDYYYRYHSLFGVGIVSKGIGNIRRHIQTAFSSENFFGALRQQKMMPASAKPILDYQTSDATDLLFLESLSIENAFSVEELAASPPIEQMPLLTCISSRDGFKSTDISVSVPRDIISGCNTAAWTLYTMTHEMSHSIVDGVLGTFLPDLTDSVELGRAAELYNETVTPLNRHESISQYLLFAMMQLDREMFSKLEDDGIPSSLGPDYIQYLILDRLVETDELLAHLFDYCYFYQGDSKKYVSSLWASWAVIPNIKNRVDTYLTRTLAALHSDNLVHISEEESYTNTIERLEAELEIVKDSNPQALYIPEALASLKQNRPYFLIEVQRTALLAKFTKFILVSTRLKRRLHQADHTRIEKREFPDTSPKNPLKFIDEHANSKSVNEKLSAWILQQIAFSG